MLLSGYVEEDFTNYKEPSLFLGTAYCDWKCCKDAGYDICQNKNLAASKKINITIETLYNRYKNNQLTSAIVLGGLEPFMQFKDIYDLIAYFRGQGDESYFIIYTGYNENEIGPEISKLRPLKNIIVKFGRYIPNQKSHYDEILGVNLASDNQYAKIIC